MNVYHSELGDCPNCDVEFLPGQVLIEYETDDGRGVWAECPDCSEVVDPL